MNEDFKTILARLGIPSAPPERREKKKGAAASNGRRKEADLWSRPDFIRCLQAHRESGDAEASPEAYFFAIARSLIFEADDRWPEVVQTDPPLQALSRRMQAIREQHGLQPHEDFWLDDEETPQEYQELAAQWMERVADFECRIMRDYQEEEMAALYQHDREEFDRRYDEGFRFFYQEDPEFSKELSDLKQSRQDGRDSLDL